MTEILNPFVDVAAARRDYRDFGWARITDILSNPFAEKVIQNIVKNVEFKNTFMLGEERLGFSDNELANLTGEKRQALFSQINKQASEGKGFVYGQVPLAADTLSDTHQALKTLLQWINEEDTVDMFKDITGLSQMAFAKCQVARFSQGQFLLKNTLKAENKNSQLGFILDLTPDWDTDWGGLLQLHSTNDMPASAFTPQFNSMIIFNASSAYSVTYLAPFIKYYKYCVMGEFVSVD
ncbi:MAG: hypothetical protein GJ680_03005 [Alteromonadaceae bacterium]|nr:hypothetical protein [Alteromonadaceae bacterium]